MSIGDKAFASVGIASIITSPEIVKLLNNQLWPYAVMGVCAYNITEGVKLGIYTEDAAQIIYIVLAFSSIIYSLLSAYVKLWNDIVMDSHSREDKVLQTNKEILVALNEINGKLNGLNDAVRFTDTFKAMEKFIEDQAERK